MAKLGLFSFRNVNWIMLAILTFAGVQHSTAIDWEVKIAKAKQLGVSEYEGYAINDLVRDLYVSGFVRITPYSIIQGDFQELTEHLLERRQMGHYRFGKEHIISTCGNSAVAWHEITYYNETTILRKGTSTVLYVLVDGQAKVKLHHTTV